MDRRPIGIFDSGVGGLSAAVTLERLLPRENYIYFGDSANMPYGGRSVENIRQLAMANAGFMASMGVKAVLVACGTVSSNAMDLLETNFDFPFVGVVEPACALAARSGAKRVALIATEASVKSGVYGKRLGSLMPDAEIVSLACPGFVPAVEAGHFARGDKEAERIVAAELGELRDFKPELLILGCTHFPFLADVISDYMGAGTRLLSVSDAAAEAMAEKLRAGDMLNPDGGGCSYYTSGGTGEFEDKIMVFTGKKARALKKP